MIATGGRTKATNMNFDVYKWKFMCYLNSKREQVPTNKITKFNNTKLYISQRNHTYLLFKCDSPRVIWWEWKKKSTLKTNDTHWKWRSNKHRKIWMIHIADLDFEFSSVQIIGRKEKKFETHTKKPIAIEKFGLSLRWNYGELFKTNWYFFEFIL